MRDERLYLNDILEATIAIESFMSGISMSELVESDLLQSAVIQKFTVIGEACNKLSNDLKSRYPEIKWSKIIGTRNILVHVYFAVDWELIWNTIQTDIPELKKQIRSLIETDFPDFQFRPDSK